MMMLLDVELNEMFLKTLIFILYLDFLRDIQNICTLRNVLDTRTLQISTSS